MKTCYLSLCLFLSLGFSACTPEETPVPSPDSQTVTVEDVRTYLEENPVYDTPVDNGSSLNEKLPAARLQPLHTPQLTPDWDQTASLPCTKGKGNVWMVYLKSGQTGQTKKKLVFTKEQGQLQVQTVSF